VESTKRLRSQLEIALPCARTHTNISVSVPPSPPTIRNLLDRLEKFYGRQAPGFPTDPYEFLVWWYCGYPASDRACGKGWERLTKDVGVEPEKLLQTTAAKLASALQAGGLFPDLRAERLQETALRVLNEFGGDLRAVLTGPISQARKTLKSFPSIADPGADRILLFAGLAPIAAVPSNCVHVLIRILTGKEGRNYSANYREAQRLIAASVPETLEARTRAYLLLKRHGQALCKGTKPKCEECPLASECAYANQ
jgi:endonuclease III